jgi:hypothetical protein
VGSITNTPSDAFQSAMRKFKARLTGDNLVDFQNTTYEQLCQRISQIQQDQEGSKIMMNMRRLQSCLEAMHQFGEIIEVFLNVSDAIAFVWGPMKFIILVCNI